LYGFRSALITYPAAGSSQLLLSFASFSSKRLYEANIPSAAIGAYTCLTDLSVKIPEEISFISFDDDLWFSMVKPRITALAQPGEAMGKAAAMRIVERIHGKKLDLESIWFKAELIQRDSC
jgi:DNA-binding LacI/PurR family transcriptional regulator